MPLLTDTVIIEYSFKLNTQSITVKSVSEGVVEVVEEKSQCIYPIPSFFL